MEYDDLRSWITAAESMGELKHVTGASWQEDIGQVAEMPSTTSARPPSCSMKSPATPRGSRSW